MPQVPAASAADHFRARHAKSAVGMFGNGRFFDGLIEAGPAGSTIELGIAAEQLLTTSRTQVHPVLVVVHVFAREGALGALLTQYIELFRRQLLLPLVVAFHYGIGWGLVRCFAGLGRLAAGLGEGSCCQCQDPEWLVVHGAKIV